ncbi:MAG: cytochrome C [Gammaproteobacteria bacterium]|nr:cytochrome C [Gammaproteobacteria bacterium]
MNATKHPRTRFGLTTAACALVAAAAAHADEFTRADTERWETEFISVMNEGERLFHGGLKGRNTVSCDQCHPNAANTHPETYPKFQQQLGKVAQLGEMVNWCIENPLEGEPLALDDPKMTALLAYIHHERRGVTLVPGKH